ncbi:MAG TPA: hypothetical protein VKK31_27580 [Thermoanaerobaculia bacterium]|nr:hypothetical protein [Thermoanaerobaculia bacterium]
MSPRIPRRILPALALLAALALPHPAQAVGVRHLALRAGALENLPRSLWSWTVLYWNNILQKNGAQIDPNGSKTDNGAQIDPDGLAAPEGTTNDNGAQTDPNG